MPKTILGPPKEALHIVEDALARGFEPPQGLMQLEVGGRQRWLILADKADPAAHPPRILWRTAPLAEVFFGTDLGDTYEVELGDRLLTGRLLHKSVWAKGLDGQLLAADANHRWRRTPAGWRAQAESQVALPEGYRPLAVEMPTLDAAQTAMVQAPPGRAVLVLGEAGFGKTTVALHRLAHLSSFARLQRAPLRALVLVPTEGLRRLCVQLLARLGEAQAEVQTFDAWALARARRWLGPLPERDAQDTPAAVIRLKRHRAMGAVLAEAPPTKTPWQALLHIFGDRARLEPMLQAAPLTEAAIRATLERTHVQFSDPAEREFAHVDADRLRTLDGGTLDEGTPWADAHTLDPEDAAVLWALHGRQHPGQPAPEPYDLIVIDEAQEFAPLELEVIGRALRPGGDLILAGDARQHMDDTACFVDWSTTLQDVGAHEVSQYELTESYRCPEAVEALARSLFVPQPTRLAPDASVTALPAWHACHQDFMLSAALLDLSARAPRASIAVLYRTPEQAQGAASRLERALSLRWVQGGDVRFGPGIQVAAIEEFKGLEVDFVFVPDLDPTTYPKDDASRRALYVAFTRAGAGLCLLTPSTFSPLVRAQLEC